MSQHVTVARRPKSNRCLDHTYTTHGTFISDVTVPNIGIADDKYSVTDKRYE